MNTNTEYFSLIKSDAGNGDSRRKMVSLLKQLVLEESLIQDCVGEPGELVPYHVHSDAEILIVSSGKLRVIIEENIIDMNAGDALTIRPWAIHLMAFPFGQKAHYYLCHLKKHRSVNS